MKTEAIVEISLVVTIYNESENIAILLLQIYDALSNYSYEVILVDDGSTDHSVSMAKACSNERTKIVVLKQNYGQTAAMAAGIDHSIGRYIVTMDGDLQNDPTDIPMMLKTIKNKESDLVAGYRENRHDDFFFRKIPSKLANALIRRLSGVKVHDYGCSLRIFRREVAVNLGLYGELHRFIPLLVALQGASITEVAVKHHPRVHGTSKYGLERTFKVVSDLALMLFFKRYFRRPIHFFGSLGLMSITGGVIINLYLLIEKVMGNKIGDRPLLMLGVLLLLAGIQFFTFGIMAELMMRTYYESQGKKTYLVREVFSTRRKVMFW